MLQNNPELKTKAYQNCEIVKQLVSQNPLTAIEQITNLLFMKWRDEAKLAKVQSGIVRKFAQQLLEREIVQRVAALFSCNNLIN